MWNQYFYKFLVNYSDFVNVVNLIFHKNSYLGFISILFVYWYCMVFILLYKKKQYFIVCYSLFKKLLSFIFLVLSSKSNSISFF